MRQRVFANPIKSYNRFMEQALKRDDILLLYYSDTLETMEKQLKGWREWKGWAKRLHVSVVEIDNETTLALMGTKGAMPAVSGLEKSKNKDESPVLVCVPRTEGAPVKQYQGSWAPEDIYRFVCENSSAELMASPRCQRALTPAAAKASNAKANAKKTAATKKKAAPAAEVPPAIADVAAAAAAAAGTAAPAAGGGKRSKTTRKAKKC